MQPTFTPPQDEAEFNRRAGQLTLTGARSILRTLKERRKALVASTDQEMAFYEKVVEVKEAEERNLNHPRGGEND